MAPAGHRIEAAALAFMASIGCGYERHLCDDPRVPASVQKRECSCRQAARAALAAADAASPASVLEPKSDTYCGRYPDAVIDLTPDDGEAYRMAHSGKRRTASPASGGEWPDMLATRIEPSGLEKLPCDVLIAPNTILRKGCNISTLMAALEGRARNSEAPTEIVSPSPSVTEEEIADALRAQNNSVKNKDHYEVLARAVLALIRGERAP